jgi:hypothetical protein
MARITLKGDMRKRRRYEPRNTRNTRKRKMSSSALELPEKQKRVALARKTCTGGTRIGEGPAAFGGLFQRIPRIPWLLLHYDRNADTLTAKPKGSSLTHALCLLATMLPTLLSGAGGYSAEGHLEVRAKLAPSQPPTATRFGFSVDVADDRYRIKTWRLADETNYHEYTFSEGTMYIFHHLARTEPLPGGPVTNFNGVRYASTIEPREIPPNDGSRAQFVWFAYASSAFLRTFTNNAMVPIWSPEDPAIRKQPFDMIVFIDKLPRPPQLPAFASFINDGFYRSYNPATKSVDVIALSAPYDRGYTNAFYKAIDETNVLGVLLPTHFVFVVYSTPIGTTDLPFERLVVEGELARVREPTNDIASPPSFLGVADVTDFRVRGALSAGSVTGQYAYAAYPITNAKWLDAAQLSGIRKKLESRKRLELEMKARLRGRPRGRAAVLCALLLVSCALPYILWRTKRRSGRQ